MYINSLRKQATANTIASTVQGRSPSTSNSQSLRETSPAVWSNSQMDKSLATNRLITYSIALVQIDYPSRQQTNNYNSLNASKVANANARRYERSEAPSFAESSYHRDYHSVVMPPITEMKKPEMQMVQGGKFSGDTTYKQEYKQAVGAHEPPLPIVHKEYLPIDVATRYSSV